MLSGLDAMKTFPRSAKVFILFVIACGIAVMTHASLTCRFAHPRELALFAVLGILAGSKKISLVPTKEGQASDQSGMGSMSVGFAVTYAAILLFGPAGGVLVGIASGISGCLYPKRLPVYQAAFNTSNIALTAYLSGHIFTWAGGKIGQVEFETIIMPAVFSTLAYYVVNTFAVATAIALSSGSSPLEVWRDSFLWTAPGFFAGSSCAVFLTKFYYGQLGLVLLLLPIPVLVYVSYKTFMEKRQQDLRHIEELSRGQERLAKLYLATIASLATAIDAKDTYTREHISRVQSIAVQIATALGLPEDDLEGIKTAALLHDIGKLGIPEHILLKPGKLSADEYAKVQKHSAIGAKILAPVQFPWPVADVVQCHHEKWDGSGYPNGLVGEAIPLGARILAIADVYDALTSKRSYREGWSHAHAVQHIRELAATHFDPNVVEAFLSVAPQIEPLAQSSGESGADGASGRTDGLSHEHQKSRGVAEDIAKANHELMALFELAQTLSSTLNLHEVLMLLTNKIKNVVQASSCVIFLKDSDGPKILRAAAAMGANGDYLSGAVTSLGDGRTGEAAASGESWLGAYDPTDITLATTYTDWVDLRSAMVVPLRAEDEILGTINLYDTEENAFTSDDLRVLNVVSQQAGVAVQNAALFENTRESSIRDPLTGLHNVRFLFSSLEQELSRAQRNSHSLSVLGMDLDNFKLINDNFGHQRGDSVLKDVAELFRGSVRDYDLVVRYSGDEFIVVLPETAPEEAEETAVRIKKAVAQYALSLPTSKLAPLGVSIGVASFPQDAGDVKTLLAKADANMYIDKRARKKGSLAA